MAATLKRIASESLVIVAHDTSDSRSAPLAKAWVVSTMQGRASLHMWRSPSVPTGCDARWVLLDCNTFTRQAPPKREKHTEQFPEEERESFRWKALATEVGDLLQGSAAIHVMDSEADADELLDGLIDSGQRFVIRLKHDRKIRDDDDEQINGSAFQRSPREKKFSPSLALN